MKAPGCEECSWSADCAEESVCARTCLDYGDGWREGLHRAETTESERSPGWLMARLTGKCGKEGRYFQHKETE